MDPIDYEYYKRMLCRNKNPFLNVMLKHQIATQLKHMKKLENERNPGKFPPRQHSADKPFRKRVKNLNVSESSLYLRKNSQPSLYDYKKSKNFSKNRQKNRTNSLI